MTNRISLKNFKAHFERRVTKFGTGAKIDAPKEYLGKMAIRSDVEVRFLSDANKFGDVFNIWEDIAFLIRYAKGIVKITIT